MKIFRKVDIVLSTVLTKTWFAMRNVEFGKGSICIGPPIISSEKLGKMSIGERCILVSRSYATALGVRSPVILRILAPGGEIAIGADTGLSGTVICAAKSVKIGKQCLIGADVMIFDTDFHNHKPTNRRHTKPDWDSISKPVSIGDNVFIGTRSIINKGVSIGEGAIVGAGSVVVSDIPPFSVAVGVPARIVRTLELDEDS